MQSGNRACNCLHKWSVRCVTVHLHAKLTNSANWVLNIHGRKRSFLDMAALCHAFSPSSNRGVLPSKPCALLFTEVLEAKDRKPVCQRLLSLKPKSRRKIRDAEEWGGTAMVAQAGGKAPSSIWLSWCLVPLGFCFHLGIVVWLCDACLKRPRRACVLNLIHRHRCKTCYRTCNLLFRNLLT